MLLSLILGAPLLGAVLLLLSRFRWSRAVSALIGCGSVAVSFGATLAALLSGPGLSLPLGSFGPLGVLGLQADQLSLWWALVVTGCGFLIHLYSVGYMADDPGFGRFFAKLNFFIFAMGLLVLADNYLFLIMGWGLVGFASYSLIGFYFVKPEAQAAAIKAFVMNAIGEVGLLVGVGVLFWATGSVTFAGSLSAALAPSVATLVALLFLVGALAKSAQLPLHTWLPYAMEGPTPVSALIHAATMVTAGVYLVLRSYPIFLSSPVALDVVAFIGAAGAIFGALVAIGQTDIKRILAFSTLSQVGYMFLGAGVGAFTASAFHFLTHAFFKALLFLGAGVIIHALHGEQDIRKMGGLGRRMPFAYWTFLIGVLALIGVPPLAGFFSKDEILVGALASGRYGLFSAGLLAAGLTAFYNVRLFSLVFTGSAYDQPRPSRRRSAVVAETPLQPVSLSMKLPVAILAGLSVVGGWLAIPGLVDLGPRFLAPIFAGAAEHHATAIAWPVVGGVLAVAALGAYGAWALYGPAGRLRLATQDLGRVPTPVLHHMFYIDTIYDYLVIRPVAGLAGWVATAVDPGLIDGLVNGLARWSGRLSRWLSSVHGGFIRRYALVLFAGLAAMLVYYLTI